MPMNNLKKKNLILAALLLTLGDGVANAASIAVYGTGVSLTAGRDNNYEIVADTTGESVPPTQAYLITNLSASWTAPVAGTQWIGPQADQNSKTTPNGCCNGAVTYLTTFDLTGLEPASAQLDLTMSADDAASIWLNGHEVFTNPVNVQFYRPGNISVSISSYFVSGVNDLEFYTPNGTGSTGLDVAISGTASSLNSSLVPEPGALPVLGALGIMGIAALIRKRVAPRFAGN